MIKPLAAKKKHTLNTDFSGINCDVVIGDAKLNNTDVSESVDAMP